MGQTTFQGPVRSLGGFISQGPNAMVEVSTATATLNVAAYAGKITNISAATTTITLPAVNASANPTTSGPGQDPNTLNNLGAVYTFFLPTAATAVKIITSNGDFLLGSVSNAASGGAASSFAANGTTIVSVNLDGATKGGVAGSYLTIVAVAANTYLVQGALIAVGTPATPFATS